MASLLLSALLISCLSLAPCHAVRPRLVVTTSRLPAPLMKHSAVYDGQDTIYIVGGHNEDRVTKFSVLDGTVEVIGTFMRAYSGAAFYDGNDIVYLGGYVSGQSRSSAGVYRYSTVHRNYSLVSTLPVAMERFALAWDPTDRIAYTFGGLGFGGNGHVDQVLRYNAEIDQSEQIARMPDRRSGSTAAWDHRQHLAYVFGGEGASRTFSRNIFRFDPSAATPSVARISATLPYPIDWPCAVFAEDVMYIVGDKDRLIRFDPRSERVDTVVVDGWKRPLTYSACVYVPKQSRIYMIGGYGSFRQGEVKERRDEITYIDLGYPDSVGVPLDSAIGAKLHSNPNYVNKVLGSN